MGDSMSTDEAFVCVRCGVQTVSVLLERNARAPRSLRPLKTGEVEL